MSPLMLIESKDLNDPFAKRGSMPMTPFAKKRGTLWTSLPSLNNCALKYISALRNDHKQFDQITTNGLAQNIQKGELSKFWLLVVEPVLERMLGWEEILI